ncbi:MAG: BTAD domain-containing putative transcriptional regulator, partial [Nocardioides sp.]
MSLRVRVLGGIAVAVDDHSVTLPPRVQLLLAALVAHRADGIDPDALLDAVYEGNPPDTAAAALRVHLAKLRDALEPGRERGASTRIARTHGRWRLRLEPDESDVGHFDSLVAEGTQVHLDGDPALAAQLLSAAVDAWSGNPFPGLDSPFVQVERQRLIGLRREVDRRLAAAWLDLGRDAEALSCVRRAREDDPFDERLAALEARARYQSAGPAAALEVIRSFRAELADELGLDPSSLIDEVETAVLRNDAALLPTRVPSGVRAVRSTTLIGRDGLLDEIAGLAPEHSVVCLEGVAGIGKSALLREVAAQHDTAAPASARAGRTPFALIHDLLLARGLNDDEPGWRDLRAYCSGAATPHDSTVLPLLAADLAARHLSGWVLVDDAETIDQASLDLLAQQVPRGVRLLLARRPSAAGRAHLDGLQPWVITVPPLTPEDSRR